VPRRSTVSSKAVCERTGANSASLGTCTVMSMKVPDPRPRTPGTSQTAHVGGRARG
jgi:hypothetical protein